MKMAKKQQQLHWAKAQMMKLGTGLEAMEKYIIIPTTKRKLMVNTTISASRDRCCMSGSIPERA